jgi:TPP-dependent pyruvate/acetoin dehydrogenase alpha subunit
LILHTYRFAAHSKGDDIRDRAEIARAKEKDPLLIHGERLTPAERQRVEADVMALIDDAFTRASADPFPATTTV